MGNRERGEYGKDKTIPQIELGAGILRGLEKGQEAIVEGQKGWKINSAKKEENSQIFIQVVSPDNIEMRWVSLVELSNMNSQKLSPEEIEQLKQEQRMIIHEFKKFNNTAIHIRFDKEPDISDVIPKSLLDTVKNFNAKLYFKPVEHRRTGKMYGQGSVAQIRVLVAGTFYLVNLLEDISIQNSIGRMYFKGDIDPSQIP